MIIRRIIIFLRNRVFLRTVIVCSILIVSGFFYIYLGDGVVRIISVILFCLFSVIMLFGLVPVVAGFCKVIGMRIGTLIKWIYIKICEKQTQEIVVIDGLDDFIKLAEQMKVKLNKKHPFKKVAMLDNIGADPNMMQIILGEILFNRLEHSERLAVIAHELAHLKMYHILVQLGSTLFALELIYKCLPKEPGSLLLITIYTLMMIAAMFLAYCASGYLCEYWADCVAVSYTKNKVAFISALKKLRQEDSWDIQYMEHPSINHRISRLNRKLPLL